MAERTDRVDQRFGDYWLRRRLGGGSFGDVYLGEHVHNQSPAAVKVLQMRLTRSEELRTFINEVRTFRLQHPHIVRVLDFGISADETPFLVMEYAPGGTLRDRHPKGSRLPITTVLAYVAPIASGLQYAHNLYLVHRDVKPENMLLGAEGELRLSDFGIATVAHSTHSLTTESMGGTVPYMAPEQIQGRPRPQSDQYALAVVVYEWLTGTCPFRGTAVEIALQHQVTPASALRAYLPDLSPEVEQVVLTALSKDPKNRFGNVQAFATALTQAAQAPVNQDRRSETSQTVTSTVEHSKGEVAVPSAEKEQQDSTPDLISPQISSILPSPSARNSNSESSSGSSPITSENVATSAKPTSPISKTSSSLSAASNVPPNLAKPSSAGRGSKLHQRALAAGILVCLILGSIIGFTLWQHENAQSAIDAQATANAQSTVDAQATANAQSTIDAQATANVQATVNAQATAIAQATAQVIAANPCPSYIQECGSFSLALLDPLNGQGDWEASSDPGFGGSCQYTNNAFVINQTKSSSTFICGEGQSFTNFVFEVQMTITQGDCGGTMIQYDPTTGHGYLFVACSSNALGYLSTGFRLTRYASYSGASATPLMGGEESHVNSGTNTLAIAVNNGSINLYVNRQLLGSVTDTSFSEGEIGLIASDGADQTTVSYSNARVWA